MKSTTEYINILRDYMAKNASKYSITRMGIFGSVARGEQTENSDVDVTAGGNITADDIYTDKHNHNIHNSFSKSTTYECWTFTF